MRQLPFTFVVYEDCSAVKAQNRSMLMHNTFISYGTAYLTISLARFTRLIRSTV